jgi:cadmium resistance protein CadD (predicted permease)
VEWLLALTLSGVTIFAATNIDDLLLLAALLADRSFSSRSVVIGQFIGITILFAASVAAAALAFTVPPALLAWLGLAPIAIGIKQLRGAAHAGRHRAHASTVAGVAAITVANGGDNVAVYVPLFAISSAYAIAIWALVFVVMTALWCYAAGRLVRHPAWGAAIERYGVRIVPWVLIALGVWILFRA